MTSGWGILCGALAIGAAIIGAQTIDHYQLAAGIDSSGGLWMLRLDTASGQIDHCKYVPRPPTARIVCFEEISLSTRN